MRIWTQAASKNTIQSKQYADVDIIYQFKESHQVQKIIVLAIFAMVESLDTSVLRSLISYDCITPLVRRILWLVFTNGHLNVLSDPHRCIQCQGELFCSIDRQFSTRSIYFGPHVAFNRSTNTVRASGDKSVIVQAKCVSKQ